MKMDYAWLKNYHEENHVLIPYFIAILEHDQSSSLLSVLLVPYLDLIYLADASILHLLLVLATDSYTLQLRIAFSSIAFLGNT